MSHSCTSTRVRSRRRLTSRLRKGLALACLSLALATAGCEREAEQNVGAGAPAETAASRTTDDDRPQEEDRAPRKEKRERAGEESERQAQDSTTDWVETEGPCRITTRRGDIVVERESITYDDAGRESVRRVEQPAQPDATTITRYEYGEEDTPIAVRLHDGTGALLRETDIELDDAGRVRQRVTRSPTGVTHRTELERDEAGRLVERRIVRVDDGTVSGVERFEYDGDAEHPRVRYYDAGGDGTHDGGTRYELDEDGRVVVEVTFGPDGEPLEHIARQYTPNGALRIETVRAGGADGGIQRRITYSYDEEGRRRTERIDDGGDATIEASVDYEYDSEGRLAVVRTTRDGRVVKVVEHAYRCRPSEAGGQERQ